MDSDEIRDDLDPIESVDEEDGDEEELDENGKPIKKMLDKNTVSLDDEADDELEVDEEDEVMDYEDEEVDDR